MRMQKGLESLREQAAYLLAKIDSLLEECRKPRGGTPEPVAENPPPVEVPPELFAPKKKRNRVYAKKEGLREGQVRILKILGKSVNPVGERYLMENANVPYSRLFYFLYASIKGTPKVAGTVIDKLPPKGEEVEKVNGYRSLLGLGYVRGRVFDRDGKLRRGWEITPAGREELKKLETIGKNGVIPS